MNCHWVDRAEIFEGYVSNTLPPEDRDAFEEHYFTCDACFDQLRTYRALQVESAASATQVEVRRAVRSRTRRWIWAAYGLAAVLSVAVLTLWFRSPVSSIRHQPEVASNPSSGEPAASPVNQPPEASIARTEPPAPPSIPLSVLAQVEVPVYIPGVLRGPVDEAVERFQAAMKLYVEGDYAGAIPGLRAAVDMNPRAPRMAFFLAISNLLTGRIDPAVDGLEKAIALGDSPYLEEAHFYLAKARLQQGNVPSARAELERAIAQHGRLEPEARQLLKQLESFPAAKDRPPEK